MKMMATAAAAMLVACATSTQAQQMSAEEFVAAAASSDMFEINSSELAKEKTDDADVTGFAEMIIADHTRASEELKTAAAGAGVAVPAGMMDKHAAQLQQLEGLSGAEFAAAYVDAQLAAHEEALNLMQTYGEAAEDEALKAHAQKTAPVIQQHYEHAQQLDAGT